MTAMREGASKDTARALTAYCERQPPTRTLDRAEPGEVVEKSGLRHHGDTVTQ